MPRLPAALALALALLVSSSCAEKKGIKPDRGPYTGSDPTVITGSGFRRTGLKVYFGKRAATHITIESDTQLRALPPPGSIGDVVPVEVEFDDAKRLAIGTYAYIDPIGSVMTGKAVEGGAAPAQPGAAH